MARWTCINNKDDWPKIDNALSFYTFGESDSQRLDILVLDSEPNAPPILMAKAKHGVRNLLGVLLDVDRIVRLFDMFEAVRVRRDSTYGAVVFHIMEEDSLGDEGGIVHATTEWAELQLKGINTHLAASLLTRPWLKAKAGLLTSAERVEPTSGYLEVHDDLTTEEAFGKHGFRFVPGLVLLGSARPRT